VILAADVLRRRLIGAGFICRCDPLLGALIRAGVFR